MLVPGAEMQGSAAIRDMVKSRQVSKVVAADLDVNQTQNLTNELRTSKTKSKHIDATNHGQLVELMRDNFDVVARLLWARFNSPFAKAAAEAEIDMVDLSYPEEISKLDYGAKQAGVALLPGTGQERDEDNLCNNWHKSSRLDSLPDLREEPFLRCQA